MLFHTHTMQNKDQLRAIQQNASVFPSIKDPCEAAQLLAVQLSGVHIMAIKNPSESVQLTCVRRHPHTIQWINNPSESVQLVSVRKHGCIIDLIDKPTEAVQQLVIHNTPSLLLEFWAKAKIHKHVKQRTLSVLSQDCTAPPRKKIRRDVLDNHDVYALIRPYVMLRRLQRRYIHYYNTPVNGNCPAMQKMIKDAKKSKLAK